MQHLQYNVNFIEECEKVSASPDIKNMIKFAKKGFLTPPLMLIEVDLSRRIFC